MARQTLEPPSPIVGDPLPRAALAVADPKRFTDYILSPTHRLGRHKARVLKSALGLDLSHAEWLREELLRKVRTSVVSDIREGYGPNTWNCEVMIEVEGPNGRTETLTTGWEATLPPRPPRLLSVYLKGA